MLDDIRMCCKKELIMSNVNEVELKHLTFEGIEGEELVLKQIKKVVTEDVIKKIDC